MSPPGHAFSSSPSKSIRTQIENAASYPDGYADRAKLVYQMAEQERWTRDHTLEMLRDPAKFARFVEIVIIFDFNFISLEKTPEFSGLNQDYGQHPCV